MRTVRYYGSPQAIILLFDNFYLNQTRRISSNLTLRAPTRRRLRRRTRTRLFVTKGTKREKCVGISNTLCPFLQPFTLGCPSQSTPSRRRRSRPPQSHFQPPSSSPAKDDPPRSAGFRNTHRIEAQTTCLPQGGRQC